jgi:stress response protein YsnF
MHYCLTARQSGRSVAETDKPGTEIVIPVLEERAVVGTRKVETDRVLVRTRVETHDETIERLLRHDTVEVERVPIGRVVEAVPEPREEGGVLIVPVVEEELVVQTRLVLREEVHIRRVQGTRPMRRNVRLRREVVTTEHLPVTAPNIEEGTRDGKHERPTDA